jgi:hypothetical protein
MPCRSAEGSGSDDDGNADGNADDNADDDDDNAADNAACRRKTAGRHSSQVVEHVIVSA